MFVFSNMLTPFAYSANICARSKCEMFACLICLCGSRLTGKAGEFLIINRSAIYVEPDKAGRAVIGKGEFCGQVTVAVLVKSRVIATLERISSSFALIFFTACPPSRKP